MTKLQRIHPNVVVRRISANQSSRNGVKPRLIIVHSTESTNISGSSVDLANVAGYLARPDVQASAHVMTDADGNSARMVADARKAWHCAAYNSVSLGIEQIGRAAQGSWTRDELRETARWIARWSIMHGIRPYKAPSVDGNGVLRHSDLGSVGGGHHDPGPAYPLDDVLALARFYRAKLAR